VVNSLGKVESYTQILISLLSIRGELQANCGPAHDGGQYRAYANDLDRKLGVLNRSFLLGRVVHFRWPWQDDDNVGVLHTLGFHGSPEKWLPAGSDNGWGLARVQVFPLNCCATTCEICTIVLVN